MRISICFIILFCAFSAGILAEEENNPLSALPSKPGPHIDKIKALGDNSWINLGQAAPDEPGPSRKLAGTRGSGTVDFCR